MCVCVCVMCAVPRVCDCGACGGPSTPPCVQVCGAVAVSGAFKLDFTAWERYSGHYQRLIVPEMIEDILSR